MNTKKIVTVWNERGSLIDVVRTSIIDSYKKNTPLPEEIADMFSYKVFETENDVRLIIEFV